MIRVDALPMVVPGVMITAGSYPGMHDVVYVATKSNSVYAIDVHSGTVLLSPNFGPPVESDERGNLGGHSPTANSVLGIYSVVACWCGPSYFVDPSDGAGRVAAGGQSWYGKWRQTS